MAITTFTYASPLHDSAQTEEIRLLYLDPGQGVSPIICRLEHVRLSSHPQYDAISYCWGGLQTSESIICNGQMLPITTSLYNALRRFRSPDGVVAVWADAICINQLDLVEKSGQIPLMGKIYSLASEVKVWLGPEGQETAKAAQQIERLGRLAEHFSKSLGIPMEELSDLNSERWDSVSNRMSEEDEVGAQWNPFLRFLQNPWFSRVWVIQEVALARGLAWLYCGDKFRWWWQDFITAIYFALHSGVLSTAMLSSGDLSSTLTAHRVAALARTTSLVTADTEGAGIDLIWLLHTNSPALATNPLDKVYALLGIAKDTNTGTAGGQMINPDYRLDPATAYQQISEMFLARYPLLNILTGAGIRKRHPSQIPGLPSWVIDWNYEEIGSLTKSQSLDAIYRSGAAPFNPSLANIYPKVYRVDGKVLRLSGIVLDEIVEHADPLPLDFVMSVGKDLSLTQQGMAMLAGFVSVAKVWELSSLSAYPQTGEPRAEALFNAMMMGDIPNSMTLGSGGKGLRDMSKLAKTVSFMESSPLAWSRRGRAAGLSLMQWLPPALWTPEAIAVWPHIMKMLTGRVVMRTQRGLIGTTRSHQIQRGDRVVLVRGGQVPFITRMVGDGDWILVGEAYFHGIMDGQAFDINQCQEISVL